MLLECYKCPKRNEKLSNKINSIRMPGLPLSDVTTITCSINDNIADHDHSDITINNMMLDSFDNETQRQHIILNIFLSSEKNNLGRSESSDEVVNIKFENINSKNIVNVDIF